MENTLLIGDYILVSKVHYGAQTLTAPLQIPFMKGTIWGTNIPSYIDGVRIPQLRLPGTTKIKGNDVIVFQNPNDSLTPIDFKTTMVKRCKGIPGDSITIKSFQISINQEPLDSIRAEENTYILTTSGRVSRELFERFGVKNYILLNEAYGYEINATTQIAEKLKHQSFVEEIILKNDEKHNNHFFNINNGELKPTTIPKQGLKVKIDNGNLDFYYTIIKKYEGEKDVTKCKDSLLIGGKVITTYTFKHNYYFMSGDNGKNSFDSRYWGLVPEDHIIGKVILTLISFNKDYKGLKSIREDRLFFRTN